MTFDLFISRDAVNDMDILSVCLSIILEHCIEMAQRIIKSLNTSPVLYQVLNKQVPVPVPVVQVPLQVPVLGMQIQVQVPVLSFGLDKIWQKNNPMYI